MAAAPGRWAGRRVLVTGGAGFVGSHVVEALAARGATAVVVPRQRDYDLREPAAARRLMREAAPELVIHAAGRVGGIGANRARPAEFFYDNLLMGVHVLHEAWRAGAAKVVIVGTSSGYPHHCPLPFHEDAYWDGYPEESNAAYSMAKKALLVQARAYRQQHGLDAIYLIPVNLYGPRDHFDLADAHVVPALVRKCVEAAAAGAPHVEVWGSGAPMRELLYVADAAAGIVAAAEAYASPEPVNLGSGQEIRLRDLAATIARLAGFAGELRFDPTKPEGQARRLLDGARARAAFGFAATTGLEEGLARTIAWYRAQQARGTP